MNTEIRKIVNVSHDFERIVKSWDRESCEEYLKKVNRTINTVRDKQHHMMAVWIRGKEYVEQNIRKKYDSNECTLCPTKEA